MRQGRYADKKPVASRSFSNQLLAHLREEVRLFQRLNDCAFRRFEDFHLRRLEFNFAEVLLGACASSDVAINNASAVERTLVHFCLGEALIIAQPDILLACWSLHFFFCFLKNLSMDSSLEHFRQCPTGSSCRRLTTRVASIRWSSGCMALAASAPTTSNKSPRRVCAARTHGLRVKFRRNTLPSF